MILSEDILRFPVILRRERRQRGIFPNSSGFVSRARQHKLNLAEFENASQTDIPWIVSCFGDEERKTSHHNDGMSFGAERRRA